MTHTTLPVMRNVKGHPYLLVTCPHCGHEFMLPISGRYRLRDRYMGRCLMCENDAVYAPAPAQRGYVITEYTKEVSV